MDGVCAGIVLYNPDIKRLQKNIEAVLPQIEKLYLVDNGSDNIDAVRFLAFNKDNISLVENGINLGVAAALNQLCSFAENDGFDWVLTLDQDSVVFDDIIENYQPYMCDYDTALLCALVIDDNEKNLIRSNELPEYEACERCITSGSLTNVFIWRKIGGFDEAMFIDCVDFDYCTKAILSGYKILRINKARIRHRVGEASEIRFFIPFGKLFDNEKFKKLLFTYNHSPERTYYYARNILYYMKKYKGRIDMRKERRIYFKWLFLKILFEKQRLKKIGAIIRGSFDAPKLYRIYKNKNKSAV